MGQDTAIDKDRIAAIILAGGAGARLGNVRKWQLRLGGRTLLGRVLDCVQADCGRLVIAADAQSEGMLSALDLPVAIDPEPHRGPAAGLIAGINAIHRQQAAPQFVLSVAADTPFLPARLVDRLAACLNGKESGCVRGAFGDQAYPTIALYRFATLKSALETQRDGQSLFALQHDMKPVDCAFDDSNDNPFFNINRVDDIVAARRRLGTNPALETP